MRVRDFMTTNLITVDVQTPILEALEIMKHNKVKCGNRGRSWQIDL